MDRRKRIIVTAIGILIVLGIIVFLILRARRAEELSVPPATTGGPTAGAVGGALTRSGEAGGQIAPVLPPPAPSAEVAAQQLAATFAERYGSFSPEGNYVNIMDLYPIVTERYQRALEQIVARGRAAGAQDTAATTTQIIATRVTVAAAGDRADATVSTQRSEIRYGRIARTYPQDLAVTLLRVGDAWRVDSATWEMPKS